MDFEEIFNEIKRNLTDLIGEKLKGFKNEGKKDIDAFLKSTKVKLKRWTALLASGDLTLDDYEWLVKSQKELLIMQALYQTGLSKIKLGHLKNRIIKVIFDTVKAVIL